MTRLGPHWVCPVCGYDGLDSPPWTDTSASDEICSSGGTHFGYDDAAGGDPARRTEMHGTLREKWMAAGMRFWSERERPAGWDPVAQLRRVQSN